MNCRAVSLVFAIIMVAGMCTIPLGLDATESTEVTPQFGVYVNYGNGWEGPVTVNGYDACIAMQNYSAVKNVDLQIDSATFTESYGYKNINTNYGKITSIGNSSETDSSKWNVITYNSNNWTVKTCDALGYYKPFADYNTDFQTGNIALYYGTAQDAATAANSLPTPTTTNIIGMDSIVGNNQFKVTFLLKIHDSDVLDHVYDVNRSEVTVNNLPSVTEDTLLDGCVVSGYGSDVYLALKNVIGNNISAVEEVPGANYGTYISNYSWMNSMFGLGTVLVDDKGDSDWSNDVYAWWTQYTSYSENGVKVVSDFVLGYYSPMDCAPNTLKNYYLVYSEGTM